MRQFDSPATLVIKDAKGRQMQASAVLHQDAHYLYANRISLIGPREKEIELLRIDTDGVINWELHVRPDSKLSDDPDYSHRESGTGWFRSSGMTQGVMIANDTIQPFADIEILEARDRLRTGHLSGPTAEYVFLQRPRDWHVPRRSWRAPDPPRLAGPWKPISTLGIRFRLLRLAYRRDDARTAQEYEQINLPGIEMAPIGACTNEAAFFAATERLWFLIRILLVFRYRQFIYTLAETKVGAGSYDLVRHTVRLEPRERDQTTLIRLFAPPSNPISRRAQQRCWRWKIIANSSMPQLMVTQFLTSPG